MGFIFDNILFDFILTTFILLFIWLYFLIKSKHDYWKSRSVPNIETKSILFDSIGLLLGKKNMRDGHKDVYENLRGNKYGGFLDFGLPTLMVLDPDLAERIMTKDFHYFYNRGFPLNEEKDPLNLHLFNLENEKWRYIRYKLTPTFTSGKLKGMFEQICNCSSNMVKKIQEESKINADVSPKSLFHGFALDVIASCAFGINLDQEDTRKEFHHMVSSIMKPTVKQFIFFLIWVYCPKLAIMTGIKVTSQELEDFVFNLVSETLKYRKDNGIVREDFLQLLLNVQQQERGEAEVKEEQVDDDVVNQMKYIQDGEPLKKQKVFTDMCVASQAFSFLLAGSESISSTLGYALFCVAQNPPVQKKLHEQIDRVMENSGRKWSYQSVKEMTYLDQVIQETQRMFPIVPEIQRVCTEDYKLPDCDYSLEKGTRVLIPSMLIQNDPEYYHSPEVFDPERFAENNFRPNGIFMPFGNGPRVCIAMRFALLELKVCLARIMHEFTVTLSEKTQLPVKFDGSAFLLTPQGQFWFQFSKRNEPI